MARFFARFSVRLFARSASVFTDTALPLSPGSEFAGAGFSDAELAGAELAGAELAGAELAGAGLAGARLAGVSGCWPFCKSGCKAAAWTPQASSCPMPSWALMCCVSL
ncbi:MAG: pentapeptide repeat-containing protein [Desulfovibrio sp.]